MKAFVTLCDRGNFFACKNYFKNMSSYIMCSDCDNYQNILN